MKRRKIPEYRRLVILKTLRLSPEQFDAIYMSILTTDRNDRPIWTGQTSRQLASRFSFELTPQVDAYVKLLMQTQRSRFLEAAVQSAGFGRPVP